GENLSAKSLTGWRRSMRACNAAGRREAGPIGSALPAFERRIAFGWVWGRVYPGRRRSERREARPDTLHASPAENGPAQSSRRATALVTLLPVDGRFLAGAGEQLAENLVVHRQQSAVALVALAALVGDLAQTPPVAGQRVAPRLRVGRQQARHAGRVRRQAEGGEHLAATGV